MLRSSLRGGRHTGTRVAGGAASGSLFWGLCSAAGLTAIMAASAQAFRAVQLAGAAYLVFWESAAGGPRNRIWWPAMNIPIPGRVRDSAPDCSAMYSALLRWSIADGWRLVL